MGVVTFGSWSYKSGAPAKSGRTHRVTTIPSGTSVGWAGTSNKFVQLQVYLNPLRLQVPPNPERTKVTA